MELKYHFSLKETRASCRRGWLQVWDRESKLWYGDFFFFFFLIKPIATYWWRYSILHENNSKRHISTTIRICKRGCACILWTILWTDNAFTYNTIRTMRLQTDPKSFLIYRNSLGEPPFFRVCRLSYSLVGLECTLYLSLYPLLQNSVMVFFDNQGNRFLKLGDQKF